MTRNEFANYVRSEYWLNFVEQILDEVGHRCEYCRKTGLLEVKHLRYERYGEPIFYKETIADVSVLCRACYEEIHAKKSEINVAVNNAVHHTTATPATYDPTSNLAMISNGKLPFAIPFEKLESRWTTDIKIRPLTKMEADLIEPDLHYAIGKALDAWYLTVKIKDR